MKPLVERWTTENGRTVAEEVLARLMAGRPLTDLALGGHEGRVDLRGLPALQPRRLQRFETQGWFVEELGDLIKFRGVLLENLDLSGAQVQSFRLHDSTVVGSRFDAANCQDWRLWGTQVSDCSFARADLREAAVGTWDKGRRNVWRRVDFSGADFRVGVSCGAVYEDCDFSGAKLAKARFEQCTLNRCRFAGELRAVVFDGRELTDRPAPRQMERIDFSEASFRHVEFLGFDLQAVSLPHDPDLRLIRRARCAARRGIEMLEGDDRVAARQLRAMLHTQLRGPGTDRDVRVFNRRDYLELGGEDLATLAEEVLSRAETECLKG
jgi:uncharacterized protein YjbI with pentapeptide repeats